MDHRAPRLPEITLEDVSLDVFSVDKRDLFRFLLETKSLDDEAAERFLNDANELVEIADNICRFHRLLASDIRKTHRKVERTPEAALVLDYLYGIQLRVLCDVDVLRKHLKNQEIGRYFPHTRRKISKRFARLMAPSISEKRPETLSESPLPNLELLFLQQELLHGLTSIPLWIAQPPGKMGFSTGTLKDLRDRYSNIYKKK